MFRPFVYISACFISGIFLQSEFVFSDIGLILASVCTFIVSAICFFKNKINISFIFLIITYLFLGNLHLALEDGVVPENNIINLVSSGKLNLDKTAEIIFKLSDFPETVQNGYRLRCEALEIIQSGKNIKSRGIFTIFCHTSGNETPKADNNNLAAGDICRIISKFRPIRQYLNGVDKRFDDYRIREKQYFTANVSSLKSVQVIKKADSFNIANFARSQKAGLAAKIDQYFPDKEEASILKAITLGSVDEELTELRYQLRMGGIFHIVSVSGIHFSILAVSLIFIFKSLGVSLKKRYIFTIISLVFFCFVVGAYPSVLRATLMACLYFSAKLLSKEGDFLNTISLASLIILLVNPMNLFSPGFQFTFVVSFFIFYFLEKFSNSESHGFSRKAFEAVLVSIAAFLASLPLNAYHFNQVSIISILNNILLVPLMFIAMNGALIFFLLVITGLPLIGLIKPVLSIVCKSIIDLSTLCSDLPFLSYRIPTPSVFLVIVYLLLLLNIYNRIKNGEKYKLQSCIFIIVMFAIILYPFPASNPEQTTVEMLDVGQGQSIFIKTSEGKTVLIDGGGNNSYSEFMGERVLSRFLWNRGIKKIDLLILTHSHYDHIGGLWPVARNFRISEFWENGLNVLEDKGYRLLLENLDSRCSKKIIREGSFRKIDDVEIQCFSPPKQATLPPKTRNDDSLVLKFKTGQFTFLLTGDIETGVADNLAEKYGKFLQAEILQIPHHGSSKSISLSFYNAVKANEALISAGKGNIFGFPSEKILNLLKKRGISVFRTDYQGKITASLFKDKYIFKTQQ